MGMSRMLYLGVPGGQLTRRALVSGRTVLVLGFLPGKAALP